MTGEFTLSRFGPTEFKTLLVLFGTAMALVGRGIVPGVKAPTLAFWFLAVLVAIGVVQLLIGLVQAVSDVNRESSSRSRRNPIAVLKCSLCVTY